MKKRFWLLMVLAIALFWVGAAPMHGTDVAELLPTRVLILQTDGDTIFAAGENDLSGQGKTLEQALNDMAQGAPGELFLGTVEAVVMIGDKQKLLEEILQSGQLRPAVQLFVAEEVPEAGQAADYVLAHAEAPTVTQYRAALLEGKTLDLPILVQTEGRLSLCSSE